MISTFHEIDTVVTSTNRKHLKYRYLRFHVVVVIKVGTSYRFQNLIIDYRDFHVPRDRHCCPLDERHLKYRLLRWLRYRIPVIDISLPTDGGDAADVIGRVGRGSWLDESDWRRRGRGRGIEEPVFFFLLGFFPKMMQSIPFQSNNKKALFYFKKNESMGSNRWPRSLRVSSGFPSSGFRGCDTVGQSVEGITIDVPLATQRNGFHRVFRGCNKVGQSFLMICRENQVIVYWDSVAYITTGSIGFLWLQQGWSALLYGDNPKEVDFSQKTKGKTGSSTKRPLLSTPQRVLSGFSSGFVVATRLVGPF